jgi:phosphatidylglycerophosphatase A
MWWKEFIFTACYTGYIPVAPGTAGTLIAMGIYILEYYFLGSRAWILNVILVAVLIYPAIRLGDIGEEFFKKKDPDEVVLDEALGYWISVLFHPFNWYMVLLAFVLFRIFDILKPYPARRLQQLNGGIGIMIDDWIAGIYTNLTLLIIVLISWACGSPIY